MPQISYLCWVVRVVLLCSSAVTAPVWKPALGLPGAAKEPRGRRRLYCCGQRLLNILACSSPCGQPGASGTTWTLALGYWFRVPGPCLL